MKILMVTSELVPYAKAGGLGDMVSALAAELHRMGRDVRVVIPRYHGIDVRGLTRREALGVPVGFGERLCAVYEGELPGSGVPVYFLDHEALYGRDGIYGNRGEPAFRDNAERFTLLCRGAFQLCKALGWIPLVMHAHDWPGALVPVYLNTWEAYGGFADTASLITIHNLGYQGVFSKHEIRHTQLDWDHFRGSGFELHDRINFLLAGLKNADILTTVSPTYAREICAPDLGEGLDGLLRHRQSDLFGVLNGMDYGIWNPESDRLIRARYSQDDLAGKAQNKAALQREMGLEVSDSVPLIGMVSRLVDQKGFGELCGPAHGSLFSICSDLALQVAILGTGDRWCEKELTSLAGRLPNLAVRIEFDNRLAHLIEAGSDFFLMPSRYEPCGLNQMYSLRYGALPIVRGTGGLADTVESYDEATGGGTGFVFDELTPRAIYDTVGWAVWAWYNRPGHIDAMRVRGMGRRFSWQDSARRYDELYELALERRAGKSPRTQ